MRCVQNALLKHLLCLICTPLSLILEMLEQFRNFSLTKPSKLSYCVLSMFFLWLKIPIMQVHAPHDLLPSMTSMMKPKPSCLMDQPHPRHWWEINPRYCLNYKNYAALGEPTFCCVALPIVVTMAAISLKIVPGFYYFATVSYCQVLLLVHAPSLRTH